jgi:hypothetical protein
MKSLRISSPAQRGRKCATPIFAPRQSELVGSACDQ